MKPTSFIGVDPGRFGAFGAIRDDGSIQVFDMPPHGKERGIDLQSVDEIVSQLPTEALLALEWNSGRPGETPDFAYRFGLQSGQLDALLFARGFHVTHLASNKWTGKLGLPGKTWAGAVQRRADLWDSLYPHAASVVRGPRGGLLDGRLDALLIAEYMKRGYGTLCGNMGGRRPPTYRGTDMSYLDKPEI